jgi:hypothetical protein
MSFPLPSCVISVEFSLPDGKYIQSTQHFLQLIDKVPLLGFIILGKKGMKPQPLIINPHGVLSVLQLLVYGITLQSFRLLVLTLLYDETNIPEDMFLSFELAANSIGAYEVLLPVITAHKKKVINEKKSLVKRPVDDVENFYDWVTTGPHNVYSSFDDKEFVDQGYTRVGYELITKISCLYFFRRPVKT